MTRHRALLEAIQKAVLDGEGDSPAALRHTVASRQRPPGDALVHYLEKVHEHAYRVTDEDVAALRTQGLSEDAIFELTVTAAMSEGMRRYRAGMDALGGDA